MSGRIGEAFTLVVPAGDDSVADGDNCTDGHLSSLYRGFRLLDCRVH
jgi:hypothetical protein